MFHSVGPRTKPYEMPRVTYRLTRVPVWWCMSAILGPTQESWVLILLDTILSRSFSFIYRRHIGLNHDGEFVSLIPGFEKRVRLVFLVRENSLDSRHTFNNFLDLVLSSQIFTSRARPWIPSGPGVLLDHLRDCLSKFLFYNHWNRLVVTECLDRSWFFLGGREPDILGSFKRNRV